MSAGNVVMIGAGAMSGAVALGVFVAASGGSRSRVAQTIATVERTYAAASGNAAPQLPSLKERLGALLFNKLGKIGPALTKGQSTARLQRQLDMAGNPGGWTLERTVAAKGVALTVIGLFGGLFGATLGGLGPVILCAVVGALLGFFGPDLMIYNIGAKRQEQLRRSLPDVLDTLIVSVEAGQGFDAALGQVARNGKGPMVDEAARVLYEMRIGRSRVEAMRALAARTTAPELRSFTSAVIQASDLGVPIGNVLREQAREMRGKRRQRAEEQAQKVPIKILFPTLFCMFPGLFIVILGPAVIRIMHSFGH